MTVRRLLAPTLPAAGGLVELEGASVRHALVLRMKVGDTLVLFDGRGQEADAVVDAVDRERVSCRAGPCGSVPSENVHLGLMLAIPKGSKLDDCVRMATELGVHEIVLLETERTIPRWSADRAASRLERLDRVVQEAAAQCERADIPSIHAPASLAVSLARFDQGMLGVVFAARATGRLAAPTTAPAAAWCAVGPEGGFTDVELAALVEAGFDRATLGPTILRVETAVPAALTLLRDRLDGFGQVR